VRRLAYDPRIRAAFAAGPAQDVNLWPLYEKVRRAGAGGRGWCRCLRGGGGGAGGEVGWRTNSPRRGPMPPAALSMPPSRLRALKVTHPYLRGSVLLGPVPATLCPPLCVLVHACMWGRGWQLRCAALLVLRGSKSDLLTPEIAAEMLARDTPFEVGLAACVCAAPQPCPSRAAP
jgi:hypothetical protein